MNKKKLLIVLSVIFILFAATGCQMPRDSEGNIILITLDTTFQQMMDSEGFFSAIFVYPLSQFINFITPYTNVGIAILIVTVVVNGLVMLLTLKQNIQMQKMQQKGSQLGSDLQAGKYKGDELVSKQRELAQLQSDFQLKARALQEDQQKRVSEEQRKINIEVQKAIDAIAKERGIDLVLRGEGIAYTIPELDISSEVITRVSAAGKAKK